MTHQNQQYKGIAAFAVIVVSIVHALALLQSSVSVKETESIEDYLDQAFTKHTFLTICALAGIINKITELWDHMYPKQPHQHSFNSSFSHLQDPLMEEETPAQSIFMRKVVPTLLTGLSLPLAAAASWGFYMQGVSMAELCGASPENARYYGMLPTIPLLYEFYKIPWMHTYKNIWGEEKEYSAAVIGRSSSNSCIQSSLSRILWFVYLSAIHSIEGLIMSRQVKNPILQIASTVGMAIFEAPEHLDHLAEVPSAIDNLMQKSPCKQVSSLVLSSFMGFSHTASTLMGTIVYWPLAKPWERAALTLLTASEMVTTTIMAQEHAGEWYIGRNNSTDSSDSNESQNTASLPVGLGYNNLSWIGSNQPFNDDEVISPFEPLYRTNA